MTAISGITLKEYPVTAEGELIPLPSKVMPARWVKNKPFEATMSYVGYLRVTGGATFMWCGEDGREWTMSTVDLDWLLKHADVVGGKTTALWRVRKRGNSYGLEWLGHRDR